ncbi:MAG: FliI/YscN family ATPase [Phycisphaerales bacterium]|nr:FliI/YscN family ATPase [Phycisphaerales bacterium]
MVVDLAKYELKLKRVGLMPYRGSVVRVAGMIVESKGPPVGIGQTCEIRMSSNGRRVLAEVVGFHGDNRVLMPLSDIDGIAPMDSVIAKSSPNHMRLGDGLLQRVLDGLGDPIDGKGPLENTELQRTDNAPTPALSRQKISTPMMFGVRSIDGLLTCGKGQRMGIFAGSGVGKSVLLGEIARSSDADVNVVALIGERGREVRQFLEESLGPEGLKRSVVIVATSDTSPIHRVKGVFTAIKIAEYFRDKGKNVLFMMDSLTRLAHAQREIGLAAGEPPTSGGYCPSVFSMLPKVTERLGSAARGSITGMITVLVEGDDMNDPVADSVRSLLDGHIVLSRELAERGHYPAVDVLKSISRLMNSIAAPEHQAAARKFKAIYSTYQKAEDLINIGAFAPGSNHRIDKAISLIDRVNDFLIQPTGQRSEFDQTVQQLCDMTESWDTLLTDAGGAAV